MPISNAAVDMQPGTIAWFAASSAPGGFVKANGAALSRTAYAGLFAVIGTTYGAGDGSTTFNVPDLRGEFIRGFDDGRGVDTGRSIGTAQGDAMENHRHAQGTDGFNHGGYSASSSGTQTGATGYGDNTTSTPLPVLSGGSAVKTASENRPRNVALLACIKF